MAAAPEVAPGNLTVFPLSSTSLRLSWQPLADEDVPGVLVNYTVRFNEKHHGGHAQNVTIEPNRCVQGPKFSRVVR